MSLAGKRIFVFEDDAFNLAVISVPLRREGCHIFFDRWGNKAVDTLTHSLPIDLILLDLMYPNNITGYDIFDQIRAVPELASIPIIAVTAADPDVEMPKTRDKGFNGFIGKPITKHFVEYIEQAVEGQPVWEVE